MQCVTLPCGVTSLSDGCTNILNFMNMDKLVQQVWNVQ